jgi:hypothetical protein
MQQRIDNTAAAAAAAAAVLLLILQQGYAVGDIPGWVKPHDLPPVLGRLSMWQRRPVTTALQPY